MADTFWQADIQPPLDFRLHFWKNLTIREFKLCLEHSRRRNYTRRKPSIHSFRRFRPDERSTDQ
ncbi:hypothetical protein [Methylocystis sp. WRRC1]|uniref:hypothetical protein n=1 Tax=Methylocystis sp. WRRC1 TaxID=1732014 RepID=UPI00351D9155